jgi:hypothetical protein
MRMTRYERELKFRRLIFNPSLEAHDNFLRELMQDLNVADQHIAELENMGREAEKGKQ